LAWTSPAEQFRLSVVPQFFCLVLPRQIDQNIMAPAALGQPAETS
jgi:hypothetical protein